jgi:hypothetical protein
MGMTTVCISLLYKLYSVDYLARGMRDGEGEGLGLRAYLGCDAYLCDGATSLCAE